jgi:hypothetical protein
MEMVKFINNHLDKIPKTISYHKAIGIDIFYVIYWIIFLALAISFENLLSCTSSILSGASRADVKNKLYCMQLAGWIDRESYSGKDYFYVCHDTDSFDYAYNEGVTDRDNARRKLAVSSALKNMEDAPNHVRKTATTRRGAK